MAIGIINKKMTLSSVAQLMKVIIINCNIGANTMDMLTFYYLL